MAEEYKYLLPKPDDESQPFWEAAKKHELRIQACASCKQLRHPPQKICPNCYSEQSTWQKMSGKGKLFTYIEVFHPVLPAWKDKIPYNIVEVALDENPDIRLTGNVVGTDDSKLKVGMPLQVTFDDVADDVAIPRWTPA